MLVLQPASGLHFPAVETLREAILNQALGGRWARVGWAVATAELPATLSAPSLCSCRTTRPCLGGRSLGGLGASQQCPLWLGRPLSSNWVPTICVQQGWLLPNICPKDIVLLGVDILGEKGPVFPLKETCCCLGSSGPSPLGLELSLASLCLVPLPRVTRHACLCSVPPTLRGPGVQPRLQHRLHGGAGARGAPGRLPEAGRHPRLRRPAGGCSNTGGTCHSNQPGRSALSSSPC